MPANGQASAVRKQFRGLSAEGDQRKNAACKAANRGQENPGHINRNLAGPNRHMKIYVARGLRSAGSPRVFALR